VIRLYVVDLISRLVCVVNEPRLAALFMPNRHALKSYVRSFMLEFTMMSRECDLTGIRVASSTDLQILLSALEKCGTLEVNDIRELLFRGRSNKWVEKLIYKAHGLGYLTVRLEADGIKLGVLQVRRFVSLARL
jgi:hypothetical protein